MSTRQESDFARLEQLLQEADERAELERQRVDEEQRNRKEADERAEQERRRAEEERRRAEVEQRNRQEADERAELERQRAEDERRRAEEAESRAHIEESKTRQTTFEEYIRTCHTLLSKPLCV
jgi:hypothetical protein